MTAFQNFNFSRENTHQKIGKDTTSSQLRELQVSVTNLPLLNSRAQEITKKLVSAFINTDFSQLHKSEFERTREYQDILRKTDFKLVISDNLSVNACTWIDKGIIVINQGLFRELLKSENLSNWDVVSFVIAHEISHTLYERSGLLSTHEKRSRYGSLDMENQCDRDAMLLMDVAGFNVRFADLSFLCTDEQPSKDLGVLSSHPHPKNRVLEQARIRNENYWNNYREKSEMSFSDREIAETVSSTKLERIVDDSRTKEGSFVNGDNLQCLMVLLKQEILRRLPAELTKQESSSASSYFSESCKVSDIPSDFMKEYEAYKIRAISTNKNINEKELIYIFCEAID